jgi:siroheme synthase-like protein
VAPDVGDELRAQPVAEVIERPFQADDVIGRRLVLTATDLPAVERAVAAAARRHNVWVNAADRPDECDFILPAIARAGRVSAAVSTDGASPALAIWLRDRIAAMLDDRVAEAADELARRRAEIKAAGGSTEDIDWSPQIHEILGRSLTE